MLARPTLANIRAVDFVHLIGTGMCLGGAIVAFDFPMGLVQDDQEVVPFALLQLGLGQKLRFGFRGRVCLRPGSGSSCGAGGARYGQTKFQGAASRQDDGAFQDVAQFPHIAWPGILSKALTHRV